MQYGLGVDLGTTQTAAAIRVDGRVEVVRLGSRRAEIPSLVFVKPDGGLLIGEAAERRGQTEPNRLAREFKRRMGDPVPILVGGSPFSAHALTAKLLRHVLDTVTQNQDGPPAAVTVTHPANWGPYKKEQLEQAIRLADAGAVTLRTEPEAAALQHATARRIANGETVAVYDLGGGTFDVAVLRREGEGFVLLGEPEGVEALGGIDFDEAVFGHVLGVLGSMAEGIDPADPEAVAALSRLRRDCVDAKEALSFDTETMIPVALPGLHTRVRLNRSELEAMITPSLEETITATRRALRGAGVVPDQLSAILLAGGSSRIPLVTELLSTEFQRPVIADPHPEHSIAMGAAVSTAATLGGASPFSGAVPPPRGESSRQPGRTLVDAPPTGGYSPVSSPQRPGAAAAAGRGAAGSAAGMGAAGYAAGDGFAATGSTGTTPDRAASTLNGDATAPYPPAPGYGDPAYGNNAPTSGAAPVSGAPGYGAPSYGGNAPASGAPAYGGNAPASGAPAHGDGGPVSFSRGAASIPGTTPAPAPAGGASGVPGNIPWPPPPLPAPPGGGKRTVGRIVMVAALAVALLAGGTTAALVLLDHKDQNATGATPPTGAPASTAVANPAPALPTDTMLVRVDTGPADKGPLRYPRIYSFKPGSDARTLLANTEVGDLLPKWSHTREQIALTHISEDGKSSIYVMDKDGSNRHLVVSNGGGRPAWSADDKKIAFTRVLGVTPQVMVIDLNTKKVKQLTHGPGVKEDPMWSPDGSKILYWVWHDGTKEIYELNLADIREPGHQITGTDLGPANDPSYSPDGKQIVFIREPSPETSDIWMINVDGTNAHQVTSDPAREIDPTWSPDGKWIAFTRGEFAHPAIVVAHPDGTGEQVLTKNGAREADPCWY